nr:MAG TPA: hypothetical protein [Caudoviricetes sp.]
MTITISNDKIVFRQKWSPHKATSRSPLIILR